MTAMHVLMLSKLVKLSFIYETSEDRFLRAPVDYRNIDFILQGNSDFIEHRFDDSDKTHYYQVCTGAGRDGEKWSYFAAHLEDDPKEYHEYRLQQTLKLFR